MGGAHVTADGFGVSMGVGVGFVESKILRRRRRAEHCSAVMWDAVLWGPKRNVDAV